MDFCMSRRLSSTPQGGELGTRNSFESIAGALVAFTQQRTWKQAALVRDLGLQSKQLRKILHELQAAGVPLEREEDHPHVYWSVPKGWLPGAVSLGGELLTTALRVLVRVEPGPDRDRVLDALMCGTQNALSASVEHHAKPGLAADDVWRCAEQAFEQKKPLRMRYRSTSGEVTTRVASPQKIDKGRAVHLIAWCHRARALRRFHFARVERIEVDDFESLHSVDEAEVDAFVAQAVDGFYDPAGPQDLVFHVADSAAHWVAADLPDGLTAEATDDGGLRVHGYVAALPQVARYVVGLGGEAEAETSQLREAVQVLAHGALQGEDGDPKSELDPCSVSLNESTE